ncbi:unnamed protein product [Sphenostylis stenocarpa]|uniref:Uncharacterized protein n=1 Tax=Sphenostylis stenocarpa TaxID=92480 RepID=A0AA86RYK6_9FABA|nr:unnamed protein product [Sphenostylis stenocarpa]
MYEGSIRTENGVRTCVDFEKRSKVVGWGLRKTPPNPLFDDILLFDPAMEALSIFISSMNSFSVLALRNGNEKKEGQSELNMVQHPLPQKENKISQSGFAQARKHFANVMDQKGKKSCFSPLQHHIGGMKKVGKPEDVSFKPLTKIP